MKVKSESEVAQSCLTPSDPWTAAYQAPPLGAIAKVQKNYRNDLNYPDNHDGVITHLESDILEYEVKWALGSITMNKAHGGDRIPVELFQILLPAHLPDTRQLSRATSARSSA